MKKFWIRFAGIVAAFVLALSFSVASAAPAKASSYEVTNHRESSGSINIYNKKGCMGATQHLYPWHDAAPIHLWKTFWLPAHHSAEITLYGTPYSYHIHNTSDYRQCRNIGKFFAFHWIIRIYRNS